MLNIIFHLKHFLYFYGMKTVVWICIGILVVLGCSTPKSTVTPTEKNITNNDTIRIANEELEYEVIIFEPGFNAWLESTARPRNYYDLAFLENRNQIWVTNYNQRVLDPRRYDPLLYEMQINYQNNINYGYEVNYMLYNYLLYFQLKYKQRLGGFEPRL